MLVNAGIGGCLFQHAYWQAMREGIVSDCGRPGGWIGNFVGPHDYGIAIGVIYAFDRLAASSYADVQPHKLLPDRLAIRQSEWNPAVQRLLVETLSEAEAEPATQKPQTTVRA